MRDYLTNSLILLDIGIQVAVGFSITLKYEDDSHQRSLLYSSFVKIGRCLMPKTHFRTSDTHEFTPMRG